MYGRVVAACEILRSTSVSVHEHVYTSNPCQTLSQKTYRFHPGGELFNKNAALFCVWSVFYPGGEYLARPRGQRVQASGYRNPMSIHA